MQRKVLIALVIVPPSSSSIVAFRHIHVLPIEIAFQLHSVGDCVAAARPPGEWLGSEN